MLATSETVRAVVTSVLAALVATVVVALWSPAGLRGTGDRVEAFVPFYLVFWPFFTVLYLAWTHLAYATRDAEGLAALARREARDRSRWWSRLSGSDSVSYTLAAAAVAVLVTVSIARSTQFGASTTAVVLGLATVAASWAQMVYSFAVDYLRLDVRLRDQGGASIRFHAEDEPRFGDYLTLALLASTMAATISADIGSREVWRSLRRNVLLAFAFNSVVVAMVVSLLFGGLVG